jgi:hypothetical protein
VHMKRVREAGERACFGLHALSAIPTICSTLRQVAP